MKRILLSGILLGLASAANAQNMQCGNKLVSQGDTIPEVAAKCGDPTHIDHSSIFRSANYAFVNGQWVASTGAQVEIPVEVWLYNLGPDRLMRQIRFEDGRVVRIDTLDYGYIEGGG